MKGLEPRSTAAAPPTPGGLTSVLPRLCSCPWLAGEVEAWVGEGGAVRVPAQLGSGGMGTKGGCSAVYTTAGGVYVAVEMAANCTARPMYRKSPASWPSCPGSDGTLPSLGDMAGLM